MYKILIVVAFLASTQVLRSQVYFEEPVDSTTTLDDRVYFGGNFSLSFGTFTFIDVSPLAGYMVTEDFSLGLGASYLYVARDLFLIPGPRRERISNSAYGGRIFARHNVFEDFFAHVEYENINNEFISSRGDGLTRGWVPGFLVGGGITRGVTSRGAANFTVLINLLHDDARSPYASALVVRGGFTF